MGVEREQAQGRLHLHDTGHGPQPEPLGRHISEVEICLHWRTLCRCYYRLAPRKARQHPALMPGTCTIPCTMSGRDEQTVHGHLGWVLLLDEPGPDFCIVSQFWSLWGSE